MMKVTLVNYTPNPEKTVALSARLCYSPIGVEDMKEKITDDQINSLVTRLISMGHLSTLEHVSFTFAVEGISRVLTHQLVRHRIASYSQQSQRYVSEHNFEYIIPNSIKDNPIAKDKFEQLMHDINILYNDLMNLNIDKEDVRYILPNAAETKIIITMNARSLLNFFQLRCCIRAQWEIRSLANEMLKLVRNVAPILFEKAGPTCETSRFCKEGKLSCGRLEALLKLDEANKNAK